MLPDHKTKIVCTIGPASESVETLCSMLEAGMNIARLNFSHGDPEYHEKIIANIRTASQRCGHAVAIMGDLPGPKMRIGEFAQEPVELESGDAFTLTTEEIVGSREKVSVSFKELPEAVASGDTLYLNDGFISLLVAEVKGPEVHCIVKVGGELRSRKGLNLPGMNLGISAFTANDRTWLEFAAHQKIDAVSQSFVASAEDLALVRETAESMDFFPFIIAKIERNRALDKLDGIIETADGIMVARGDLGVETPIEEIAMVQKRIIHLARMAGKPVITATQMLESMTDNRRPTRAEATDVANAILDGTDCVMLSGESAMGRFPVDAVAMLASIARSAERNLPESPIIKTLSEKGTLQYQVNLIALGVHTILSKCDATMLIVPTQSGDTARNIARFRHAVWGHAVTMSRQSAGSLLFSYGVYPHFVPKMPENWDDFAATLAGEIDPEKSAMALLTEGPSPQHPETNHRLELITVAPD
ncbi:MAG: pyruvate kinase [Thermodesulfobacteriota bacterium]|nr:pyruvate kinase [Thermodesulfobacteriota bacterium]